jgi:imidazolonepropionase-like amidohydrolase
MVRIIRTTAVLVLSTIGAHGSLVAQRTVSGQARAFVRSSAPVIALTNARVIDGTGAAARENQTVVMRDGLITYAGPAAGAPVAGAEIIDLAGHTVLPGFVMLHEHMFYPAGNAMYNELGFSFPRLYLAGGATTIRTGGSMVPYADLNLKRAIDAGTMPGPKIDATAPYLNGPGLAIPAVKALRDAEDARRMTAYWADEGFTSFKAYMHITRDELRAVVEEAHRRGLKVTGHLCSVTYREAVAIGIDNLEHGFFASTDFVPGKEPDRCPGGANASLTNLDPGGDTAKSLIRDLVSAGVAITSTLTVFETSVPGQPRAPDAALDAMLPEVRDQYLRRFSSIATDTSTAGVRRFRNMMDMEVAFFRAGGLLVAGTDPTGYGGVVAGYSNQREVELLVQAGLTPLEAIRVCTLNGATYLGQAEHIGSIAAGKGADLMVVRGNPAARIEDIENVTIVFKDGIAWDPAKLIASVRGSVGLR